jgi:hypothetical protein
MYYIIAMHRRDKNYYYSRVYIRAEDSIEGYGQGGITWKGTGQWLFLEQPGRPQPATHGLSIKREAREPFSISRFLNFKSTTSLQNPDFQIQTTFAERLLQNEPLGKLDFFVYYFLLLTIVVMLGVGMPWM